MKRVIIGGIPIGGGAPICIQSMTNTDTRNVDASSAQIEALAEAGCAIVRLAVPDEAAARALAEIKRRARVPLIADIHFDHTLALIAMEAGIDALRLNPGNIRNHDNVKTVIREAKARNIVIRVGVNAGSLDRAKYREPSPENMVASAREHIVIMEDLGFTNIKVSLKSSSVRDTIAANRLFRAYFDHPLHLGVTEAGTLRSSLVKSTLGIGTLLLEGIGDTIRVSITGDPVEEVIAARMILRFAGLDTEPMVEVISCPTCGRTTAEIEAIALEVERRSAAIRKKLTVAVMGCVVNGPGEARHADFGIAAADNGGFLYFEKENAPIRIRKEDAVEHLMRKIENA